MRKTNQSIRRLAAQGDRDLIRVIALFWSLVAIGLLSLLIPAAAHVFKGNRTDALVALGSGLFLAGGSVLAGSLIGFLFGVPRRHPDEQGFPALKQENDSSTTVTVQPYVPNTNLEQISDWLTKVIVGIGLVEIRSIVKFFRTIALYSGPAFWNAPAGEVIAGSILVHYSLVGFFQGFLLAYLYLPGAFARAHRQDNHRDNKEQAGHEIEKTV
jgi:hypothetical protein